MSWAQTPACETEKPSGESLGETETKEQTPAFWKNQHLPHHANQRCLNRCPVNDDSIVKDVPKAEEVNEGETLGVLKRVYNLDMAEDPQRKYHKGV